MGNNLEECVPRFPRLQTCLCAPSAPSPSPALQPLGGSHAQSHGSRAQLHGGCPSGRGSHPRWHET